MKKLFSFLLVGGAAALSLSASSVCPSTPTTTSDCNYLITVGSTGAASVSVVPGSSSFNSMITFVDGTTDPGNDGSLVGVVNDYSRALTSITLSGSNGSAGIFDFSYNGICVYTNAAYCGTAASGYEGPTSTFTNLRSTILFENNLGTVDFGPALGAGASTYFSLADSAASLGGNGGLTVVGDTFAAPEPAEFGLIGLGLSMLAFAGIKKSRARQ